MSDHPPRRVLISAPITVRKARAAHDSALNALGLAIVRGDYQVGSLLPSKEQLIEQLGVSHTTLREALQTLTAKGMMTAKAKVGTRILDERHWNMFDADILAWRAEVGIPDSFLAMLLETRQSVEPAAAALAAARRSERDVTQLQEWLERLRLAGRDRTAFVEADIGLHQCILEASNNPFMLSLSALIRTALAASLMLSEPTSRPRLTTLSFAQHRDLVDAIAAGDSQRAGDAMATVIKQGWHNVSGRKAISVGRLEIASFSEAKSSASGKRRGSRSEPRAKAGAPRDKPDPRAGPLRRAAA